MVSENTRRADRAWRIAKEEARGEENVERRFPMSAAELAQVHAERAAEEKAGQAVEDAALVNASPERVQEIESVAAEARRYFAARASGMSSSAVKRSDLQITTNAAANEAIRVAKRLSELRGTKSAE